MIQMWWWLFLALCPVDAFVSNAQFSRDVYYNGKPTREVSVSFLATSLDSTGTFTLDSGCVGTIQVAPPVLNYVVQHIANVPRDVYSFQEVSCSVTSIDAYRDALAASGETLDVVLNYDADNSSIVPGNSSSAFRRRLLQTTPTDSPITSFAATSKLRSNMARESLDTTDRYFYGLVSGYTPLATPVARSGLLGVLNTLQGGSSISGYNGEAELFQRLADVEAKLVQRGQNTDAAVAYLTQFTVDAYNQQRTDYASQQTQLNGLLAAQNATQLAVGYLFNATLQNAKGLLNLTQRTSSAIEGILDYRVADRSIFQAWIDNNELKDLATALYFADAQQLPANYTPFVRNPGVAPNTSYLNGEGSRILLDTVTMSSVYRIAGTNQSSMWQAGRVYSSIFQNRFSTYVSSKTALLFDVDQMDSRFFLSLLGPPGCTPPYLNPGIGYVDLRYYGDILLNRYTYQQAFSSLVPCDMWIEAQFNNCYWSMNTGSGPTYSPSFRWTGDPGASFSPLCYNITNTDGYASQMLVDHTIITDINALDGLLNTNLCGGACFSQWNAPSCSAGNAYQQGGYYDQVDLMHFSSQKLQISGNTSARDCVVQNLCAQGGQLINPNPGVYFTPIPAYCAVPTNLSSASMSSVVDNYLALMVVGYTNIDIDISQIRLAKYGRLPGVETETVSNNLYVAPQYDSLGNLIYDGPATPLRCEKTSWNAYTNDVLPVYNFQVNVAGLVTNNVTVAITCPSSCNNTDQCYNMTSSVVQNIRSYDVGSFILDANFNVMGNVTLVSGSQIYDVPPDKLSVSPVIEARSFSPTYMLLPQDMESMPDWNTFVGISSRNVRYAAEYGTVSPQAYIQNIRYVATNPYNHLACDSYQLRNIPGSRFCTVLAHYILQVQGSAATLTPVQWTVSFDVTALSGRFYDTVDLSNGCPVVDLVPTATGALALQLQNDDTIPRQLSISYAPLNSTCSGICCQQGVQVLAQPRFVTTYLVPQCGWINLTLTVLAQQADMSYLSCFNASGQSLYASLQTAATALSINFFNPVNVTQIQNNAISDFYTATAYQTLIDFATSQSDASAESLATIAQLEARRDAFQQGILAAQRLAPVPATFPLNPGLLQQQVQGLLDGNVAIDNEILTVDLPYIAQLLDNLPKGSINPYTGKSCTLNPLTWLDCIEKGAEYFADVFLEAGDKGKDLLNDLFKLVNNDGCPEGFANLLHPVDALSCMADDLISLAIGIGIVLLVGCIAISCGPSILGFVGHKLMESGQRYKEKIEEAKKTQTKKTKKKKSYSQVNSDSEED